MPLRRVSRLIHDDLGVGWCELDHDILVLTLIYVFKLLQAFRVHTPESYQWISVQRLDMRDIEFIMVKIGKLCKMVYSPSTLCWIRHK